MSRSLRRFSALLALFAMVFAQLAMAAHACSLPALDARLGAAASIGASTPQSPPCHQAPASHDGSANLCNQHCHGNLVLDDAPPPVAAFDSSAPSLRVTHPAPAAALTSAMSRQAIAPAPPPPPLLFGVLRI